MENDILELQSSDFEEDRYARLRLIPWWDQDRLNNATIMVVGAGAIGNELIALLKGSLPKGTLEGMLIANNAAPQTVVQVNTLRTDAQALTKVLEGEGIEEIDPMNQPFNADTMEAIMAAPAEEGEESGIVKQVYLKGYKKGDKVLRYAQVIVTQ